MEMHVGYYAIIPASVRYDSRLRPNEKLMYGEITALSNKHGYCFATNEYFAKLYGVSINSVSIWISNLQKFGYITREIVTSDKGKITGRKIFINGSTAEISIQKKLDTPKKVGVGIQKKLDTSIQKKLEHNNTSVNTTRINNIYSAFEAAWKIYPSKRGKSQISKSKKEEIQKLGEEQILLAVKRYMQDVETQRANGFHDLKWLNGSTFFNGRYKDYLGEEMPAIEKTQKTPKGKTRFSNFTERDNKEQLSEFDRQIAERWMSRPCS